LKSRGDDFSPSSGWKFPLKYCVTTQGIACVSFLRTEKSAGMPFAKNCRHNIATENKTTQQNTLTLFYKNEKVSTGLRIPSGQYRSLCIL
jgi:hypothetical protein